MARSYALVLATALIAAVGGWRAVGQTPPAAVPAQLPVEPAPRLADLEVQLKFAQLEQGPRHPNVVTLKKKIELFREVYQKHGLRPDGTSEEAGRFTVTPTPQAVVMVDTKSGESWYLRGGKPGAEEPVWVPIKRLAPAPLPPAPK